MDDVLPEAIFLLGGVPLVHGATTVGSSLIQAHQRMESLEHAARIMLTARMLGRVNALTPENAQTLRATRVATHQASQQKTQTRSL
jgi:ribulose-5-phosphate 4-epimerase/fuculose-1-phosphate aldolase